MNKPMQCTGIYGVACFTLMLLMVLLGSCHPQPQARIGENEFYVCSMDPQVMEKQPGLCPICKMPLAKTVIDKSDTNSIRLSLEQMKLADIHIDSVSTSMISQEHTLNAVFSINQNRTEQVSTRIGGRIEKLYHKVIGEQVEKGEKLYEIYSRDLLLAQEEYLLAVEQSKILKNEGKTIVSAARNKLVLWGLNEMQLNELERSGKGQVTITIYSPVSGVITEIPYREGDYVNEGAEIFKTADLNSLWVEAQLYSDEMKYLEEGKKVEIIPASSPGERISGTVTFSNPELQGRSKINLVRIEVDNSKKQYRPGEQAYVILKSTEKKGLIIPANAVIQSPGQSYVWIQTEKEKFTPRMIKTGIMSDDRIEVLSGLMEGDKIVTRGAYLINSEFMFKRGNDPMAGMLRMKK